MTFEDVKTAIINILSAAAPGTYQVTGSKKQSKGANENLDLPRVTVYYQAGNFPKSASNYQAEKDHNATYQIEFTVIVQSYVDLSVLNNPSSTALQIKAALEAIPDLSDQADKKMDEIFGVVYQVLMAADKYDLDLPVGTVVNRWIDNFQKDNPLPRGEYLILTGNCNLTCRMEEIVTGVTGVTGNAYDITTDIEDDQGNNAGASGNLGG
jgi:hypothetical protein